MQDIKVPDFLVVIPNILGDPIRSLEKSFDCWTLGEARTIPIIYERLIYSLLLPAIFAIEIIIIYIIL